MASEGSTSENMATGGGYYGQGHSRIELGSTTGECYIKYEQGVLEIRCTGKIIINGKEVHIN